MRWRVKKAASPTIKTCLGNSCKAECSERTDVSSNYLFVTGGEEKNQHNKNQNNQTTNQVLEILCFHAELPFPRPELFQNKRYIRFCFCTELQQATSITNHSKSHLSPCHQLNFKTSYYANLLYPLCL